MKSEHEYEYLKLIEALIVVGEATKGTPAKGDDRVLDAEGLFVKVFYHACSAFYLSRGTTIKELSVSLFDCASIQVLCRAALESFLVFQYVFMLPKNKEEKDFRYRLWEHAGLMERQEFPAELDENKRKLAREKLHIEDLRLKIKNGLHFQALTKGERKNILRGKWRLQGWRSIAEDSDLSEMNAKHVYSYLCGYAHASNLSIMQIRQAKTAEQQQELTSSIFGVLMIVMAFMVKAYLKLYPQPQNVLTDEQTKVVDHWYKEGSGRESPNTISSSGP